MFRGLTFERSIAVFSPEPSKPAGLSPSSSKREWPIDEGLALALAEKHNTSYETIQLIARDILRGGA